MWGSSHPTGTKMEMPGQSPPRDAWHLLWGMRLAAAHRVSRRTRMEAPVGVSPRWSAAGMRRNERSQR
jgi:hypothetical protein